MNKNILIFDDQQEKRQGWVHRLQSLDTVPDYYQVTSMGEKDFHEAFHALEGRRKAARDGESESQNWNTPLDGADILIIDYDLMYLDNSFITGEEVSYLARAYSTCGYIVALNQYTEYLGRSFDLTLRGHPKSFADLNIPDIHLFNAGLWIQREELHFRPWYWPLLPNAERGLEARADEIQSHLTESILDFLGFPSQLAYILPRSVSEFLGSSEKLKDLSFKDFVTGSDQGLRPRDKPADQRMIARVAAARLGKWIERLILGSQSILVDAPHLATRYPSLLTGDVEALDSWNATTLLREDDQLGIDDDLISDHLFNASNWASRPCWFWQDVSSSEDIKEVAQPWDSDQPDYVFCEDVSSFAPRPAAREFVADLPSPYVRRYISDPESDHWKSIREELDRVQYVPSVRLSL